MKRVRQLLARLSHRVQDALHRVNRALGGVPLLLKRTLDAYNAHDGTFVSAAMAYYFFFTLFPLVLAMITIGSLFLGTQQARETAIELIGRLIPALRDTIAQVIDQVLAQRGAVGIVALLGLVYSASGLFGVLLAAVDRAWGCLTQRSSLARRVLSVVLVLVLSLIFFLSALATTAFEALRQRGFEPIGLSEEQAATLYMVTSLVLSLALTVGAFLVLYWRLPAARVHLGDAWPAALASGIAWETARQLYAWYLSRFANFTLVYGSLAAVIGLLTWFYLTAYIILLGTELTAQLAERHGRKPGTCDRY